MESKNYNILVNITKKKQAQIHRKQTAGCQCGWGGRIYLGRSGNYKLLCVKQDRVHWEEPEGSGGAGGGRGDRDREDM